MNFRETALFLYSPCNWYNLESKVQGQILKVSFFGFKRIYLEASKGMRGGPLHKNIKHQGINDAFVEKASVTYYCEDGK